MPTKKKKNKKRNHLLECILSDEFTKDKLINLRRCLEQRADVNIMDSDGNTPLHLAVRHERVTIIKLLLKRGADVSVPNMYGNTPLHEAVRHRELPVVMLLIKNGADVFKYNLYGNTPLHEAVCAGNTSIVELLLDNGADINAKTDKGRGYSPLHVAARFGLTSIANLLLDRGANVCERDRYGSTVLHEAASSGERAIVKLFLNKGVDVNSKDQFKSTPLHSAASAKEISVVKLLLHTGADVNAQAINGDTPLHRAARSGDISVVNLLLKSNAVVNPYTMNGNTPLHEALRSKEVSIAKLLLDRGAKVNVQAITRLVFNQGPKLNDKTTYGRTPLHEAARSGNMSAVKLLLDKGADVNLRDVDGKTPLHEAVLSTESSIIKLLVKKGADINAMIENGNTVVHIMVFEFGLKHKKITAEITSKIKSTHCEISNLKLLLDKGVKINVCNENGKTPLHLAVELGLTSVVDMLLDYNADLTVKDKYGYTPLHKSVRYGKILVVELLLNKDADVNTQNGGGNTPLHDAVRYNQTSIIDLLLNKYVNVNARNYQKETPLHWAAEYGLTKIVDQLVDKGADLNVQTRNGTTPLHEAARYGRTSTAKTLLYKGADVNAQRTDGETPLHLAVRHDNIKLVILLICCGADVTLINMAGETPLSYALLLLSKRKKMVKLLQLAEKKTKNNRSLHTFPLKNTQEGFQNIILQNDTFKYMKATDTSGLLGQLYEIEMASLVLIRLLNHHNIKHGFFLGTNVDGIGAMDDICLRYHVRGHQMPVLLFIQIKHKNDPGNHQLTDELLWDDSDDFSLRKYFKSYIMIKERFQKESEDPMFNEDFDEVDCYFVLYTSAKERVIKKNKTKVNKIVHDIINTGKNSFPFRYKYDEDDINRLTIEVKESVKTKTKKLETNTFSIPTLKKRAKEQVIDFFERFWIYPGQAREDEVECQLKDEINKYYNNDTDKFKLHANVIYLISHDTIKKWWMLNGEAPYLSSSDDFFRDAKSICVDYLLQTICNAINYLQLSVDLRFEQYHESIISIKNSKVLNPKFCRLFNTNNEFVSNFIKFKNEIISLLPVNDRLVDKNHLSHSEQFLSFMNMLFAQNIITVRDMDIVEQYKYLKRAGTSEVGGTLFRIKMLNLIDQRLINHKQIEDNYLIANKIRGINVMTDICLRCQEKGTQRPTVLFLQLIHREDPEKAKLSDVALWGSCRDIDLKKYFKSYLMIRERFLVGNEDPMFEGKFCDVNSYFIIYTSAKESLNKKKTKNRISKVIHDLINTRQNLEPFQYDYNESDIDCLTKAIVIDELEELATVFLRSVMREKIASNLLSNGLIAKYHVAMAREVLIQCKLQPTNEEYRLWKFRSEFLSSDVEYLVTLKNQFAKILSSKRNPKEISYKQGQQNTITDDDQKKLISLKFFLPLSFGNIDMTFRGNKAKVERRMKSVANKLMNLLKSNNDSKILKINDDDVGPAECIEQGIVGINGGLGGAVGNLLILDNANLLKFDTENDALPHNASLFLKELKDERHKPYNEDLSAYKIKVDVKGFPKYSFYREDYDDIMIQARDFVNKFWFYPEQAKYNEMERILKDEIGKKYTDKIFSDIIFLHTQDAIQKWWLQTIESPFLSRASERLERAELADTYNLLQTVINFMYISEIYTIDIKVNKINDIEQSKSVYDMFSKITVKLFHLFDPQFNVNFRGVNLHDMYEKPTFSLNIHPEMEWVALIVTSKKMSEFENCNVQRRFVAKAGPGWGQRQARDGFRFYEILLCGRIYRFRDCFNNICMEYFVR